MAVLNVNDIEFKEKLSGSDKVVVKFYADWCGSCKLFSPKFKRISENEQYKEILFLEVNAEDNEEARKLAGVDNLPYLAVFKSGILLEGSASSKEEYLLSILDKLN